MRLSFRPPLLVIAAAVAVAALRMPFVGDWLGKDESGFLIVGGQWHRGGSSLYGNYWVDRPPILITIFRAADLLGGAVPLRLIGVAAASISVLAVARSAHLLAGRRAAGGAALVATALLASPLTGATAVNGELLAAPFIAVGVAATVEAAVAVSTARLAVASVVAGAAGLAAILVKQNMLDVLVFGAVLLASGARAAGTTRTATAVVGTITGCLLTGVATATWTVAHGTSLPGVWFAMYRFRVMANAVMAAYPTSGALDRGLLLGVEAAGSGMVLVVMLMLLAAGPARPDGPAGSDGWTLPRRALVALLVVVAYDAVSIYLGKSYWSHYLVQAIVPLSIGAGIALARRRRLGHVVIGLLIVSTLVSFGLRLTRPSSPGGNLLGAEIARVARPSDTIVTVWGHPDVTRASRLTSPYPYLWYLPARTLDPRVSLLNSTLAGRHRPTWFVTWSRLTLPGVGMQTVESTLARNYRQVGVLHGHRVFLRRGVDRAAIHP